MKTVTNLSLKISKFLDILEQESPEIKDLLYICRHSINLYNDILRQIDKKIENKDSYVLDFMGDDLAKIAENSTRILNKLSPKINYKTYIKELQKNPVHTMEEFEKFLSVKTDLSRICLGLRDLANVLHYQTLITKILEEEDEDNKIENVMLSALREFLPNKRR